MTDTKSAVPDLTDPATIRRLAVGVAAENLKTAVAGSWDGDDLYQALGRPPFNMTPEQADAMPEQTWQALVNAIDRLVDGEQVTVTEDPEAGTVTWSLAAAGGPDA